MVLLVPIVIKTPEEIKKEGVIWIKTKTGSPDEDDQNEMNKYVPPEKLKSARDRKINW